MEVIEGGALNEKDSIEQAISDDVDVNNGRRKWRRLAIFRATIEKMKLKNGGSEWHL